MGGEKRGHTKSRNAGEYLSQVVPCVDAQTTAQCMERLAQILVRVIPHQISILSVMYQFPFHHDFLKCLPTPQLAQVTQGEVVRYCCCPISILPSVSQKLPFPGSFASRGGHVTKELEKEQDCGEPFSTLCLKDTPKDGGTTKQKFPGPWH